MDYSEVYDVIAKYANDQLPVFADAWSRFPVGTAAKQVADRLRQAAECTVSEKIAEECRRAAEEIEKRAQMRRLKNENHYFARRL